MTPPRLPWNRHSLLVPCLLTIVAFGAGFAAGWLGRQSPGPSAAPSMVYIREQAPLTWRFINPLLECDAAENLLSRAELLPFRHLLVDLVASRKSAGDIMFASIYFRELNDGLWLGINEKLGYIPASLLKLPTLIAVLKRAEHDPAFLARRVRFEGRRDDNAIIAFRPAESLEPGQSYTVEELCRRMIRNSDNSATGLLNDLVTMPEQDDTLRGLGVLPELLRTQGKLDVKSVSAFLRVLYNASYLSREHSEMALETMAQSSFRAGIVAGVPGDVTVCSKYGEAAMGDGVVQLHEFAIVYYQRRPYLVGVMTQGRDFEALARFIRDVSRTIYDEVARQDSPAELEPNGVLSP
jgi:beta-lactamase class A